MKNTENIKMKIISESDYEVVKKLASNYNMTVEQLGRLLSKKTEKDNRQYVRFSVEEKEIIDKRRNDLGMTMSEYCRRCYMKAIEDGLYMNMDIKQIKKDTYNKKTIPRDIRAAISFDDAEAYKVMIDLANKFKVQFSSLIRYFALNVEL